ncbi:MAG: hypothetical protein RSF83_10305, partial [Hungatella sp.]
MRVKRMTALTLALFLSTSALNGCGVKEPEKSQERTASGQKSSSSQVTPTYIRDFSGGDAKGLKVATGTGTMTIQDQVLDIAGSKN